MNDRRYRISPDLRRRILECVGGSKTPADVGRSVINMLIESRVDARELSLDEAKSLLVEAMRVSREGWSCHPPCHAA